MEETEQAGVGPKARPKRANELDATGLTVAANVRALRREMDLSTRELSERLARAGRPILPNAITKIEQKQRRVDADDLAALAVALGVTPNALLLPPGVPDKVHFTGVPGAVVPPWYLWAWACGEHPLPPAWDPAADGEDEESLKRQGERYHRLCSPHRAELSPRAVEEHGDLLRAVADALRNAGSAGGLDYGAVARWAEKQASRDASEDYARRHVRQQESG